LNTVFAMTSMRAAVFRRKVDPSKEGLHRISLPVKVNQLVNPADMLLVSLRNILAPPDAFHFTSTPPDTL